ncbi:uncharacterized protein LOC123540326 isoform X3 [Mercenaria mercenaria]|uniref:uncharacterized protein LOC123540326 isoform X3 n=1 Tax=Mercenaria mercenaria TaxID=6596 RepID=UPI00234F64E7|nr:uncharacterized protein LOC123540326 isoform X3 [Mercenaria mercenaria]
MAWGSAPTLLKVVLVLALIGFVLDLIGFATAYWRSWEGRDIYGHYAEGNEGLWRSCWSGRHRGGRGTYETCGKTIGPSWFEATQAFETLGFIAAIVALVLIVLYIFVPQTSGKRIVFILGMVACFAAAGCIILGIIIYGSKVETNLSWSFALCTIAGIIFGVSGILLIVDMLKR